MSVRSEDLDGWKQIASHFNRSVRSVQRWERNEGMPVRRHFHSRGASVFAIRTELDEWLHRGNMPQQRGELRGTGGSGHRSLDALQASLEPNSPLEFGPAGCEHDVDLQDLALVLFLLKQWRMSGENPKRSTVRVRANNS